VITIKVLLHHLLERT